ncbi:sugar ABC transporter permease [Thermofilum sp.]|uniref:sugar ABC transporter permease n=1 Tax=Thermofilum sp. TaxID=1961369 RepID=UPI00316103F7
MRLLKFREIILFLAPLLFTVFVIFYGIAWNFWLSLTSFSIYHPRYDFVGINTYLQLFNDYDFRNALVRTIAWAGLLVIGGNILGLIISTALFQIRSNRLRSVLTSYFIYPMAIPLVASGVIWRWLFESVKGFNAIFASVGLPKIDWLTGENAFWSLVGVSMWVYSGFIALLYLATFYNVPPSAIEAARVDGADTLTIMVKIVIPYSKLGFILGGVFSALFALQMFDLPYSVLYINPFTSTLVMYLYNKFVYMAFNISSAACIFLIALSASIAIPYSTYGLRKWILGVIR